MRCVQAEEPVVPGLQEGGLRQVRGRVPGAGQGGARLALQDLLGVQASQTKHLKYIAWGGGGGKPSGLIKFVTL